jgi:formylglycine-generating enzyme required for sulfatase activity
MKLSTRQRAIAEALFASEETSLAQLAKTAGLNPALDLMGADFRGVDFTGDDRARYNFSGADLRGADLSAARNVGRAMFAGALTDGVRWPANLGPMPGSIVHDHPDAPEMVVIPPGRFVMGIPKAETESLGLATIDNWARPQHEVRISRPFLLGRFPVTVGQFATFVADTGHDMGTEAENWRTPGFPQTDAHPVVCVSHADAVAYAGWLSDRTGGRYRLPSEAEWEYACRAGTTTARWWGDDWDPEFANGNREHTTEQGAYKANPFGLYDMLGNVWEWCADGWHDTYTRAPTDGSAWQARKPMSRVMRGGAWYHVLRSARADYRNYDIASVRASWLGFRLARTL